MILKCPPRKLARTDKTVSIVDATTGEPSGALLTGHTESVNAVSLPVPDGKLLQLGSDDVLVRLWDLATHASNQYSKATPTLSRRWRSAPTESFSPPAAATEPFASGIRRRGSADPFSVDPPRRCIDAS